MEAEKDLKKNNKYDYDTIRYIKPLFKATDISE